MSNYIGDYTEDYVDLNVKFTTRDTSGVPTTFLGSPVLSVYKSNNVSQSTAGVTLTVDFDSSTGLNNAKIDLSSDAFYVTGEDYQIVVTAGTVDTVSVIGEVIASFSIQNKYDPVGVNGASLSAMPWNAAWDAEVESEVNDALDTLIAELGVAAPAATPTLRTGLMLMYMALRNQVKTQTSGVDALEVYNNAGTLIAKKLITDDGADYTEAKMTSG